MTDSSLALAKLRERCNELMAKHPGAKPVLDKAMWILEALDYTTSPDLIDRAIRGLRDRPAMPAIKAYTDPLDGSHSTLQPPPQSALIQACITDGSDIIWQDDPLPSTPTLTWDGERGEYHAASNSTVAVFVYVSSRDGTAQQVTLTTSGFSGLVVEPSYARYMEQRMVSFFGYSPYNENFIHKFLRAVTGNRLFTERPKGGAMNPVLLVDDMAPVTIPANSTQMFCVDVTVPKGAAGDIAGTITVTDANAAAVDLPITIRVRGVELTDANPYFIGAHLTKNVAERALGVNEFGGIGPGNDSGRQSQYQDWLDEGYRVLRKHGLDPFSGDVSAPDGSLTPVPDARELARLDGSIYAGLPYRGMTPHTFDVIGTYNDLLAWTGMAGAADDAARTTIVGGLIDDRKAVLTANGLSIEDCMYTLDEGDLAVANQRGLWAAGKPVWPLATGSTTTGHLIEEGFTGAPAIRAWCGSGNCATRDGQALWQAERDAGKKVGFYNGIYPARAAACADQRPYDVACGPIWDMKVGNNIWFTWETCYAYAFEMTHQDGAPAGEWTPTTGPAPGVRDVKRQNLNRYMHTFGNAFNNNDTVFRRNGGRVSARDGVWITPKTDFYYADDPLVPGTFGFYVDTKCKYLRRGIQIANLIALARGRDAATTNALLANFYPLDPHTLGAGSDGNATALGAQDRSFAPAIYNGQVAMLPTENNTGDDMIAFERALFDIMEA